MPLKQLAAPPHQRTVSQLLSTCFDVPDDEASTEHAATICVTIHGACALQAANHSRYTMLSPSISSNNVGPPLTVAPQQACDDAWSWSPQVCRQQRICQYACRASPPFLTCCSILPTPWRNLSLSAIKSAQHLKWGCDIVLLMEEIGAFNAPSELSSA